MNAETVRTWPLDWEARKRGDSCLFCERLSDDPFYRGRVSDGYLERKGVSTGHSILVLRGRHAADFTELSPSEVAELWADVQDVGRLTQSVFDPCHVNYELLGNSVPHIHVHVIPRYLDDPAPGRPLAWEPVSVEQIEFSDQHRKLMEAAASMTEDPAEK